jgi:hypothetical protein
MKSVIIYDCEIVNAIPPRDGAKLDGIVYTEGWGDHAHMGISVIGVYDYLEERSRVFCQDNAAEFERLWKARELCVGYNNIPFDNALIDETEGWCCPPDDRCYDILREIWAAAGLGPRFDFRTHGGYSLDALCKANFGRSKSGNGAFAPVLWQQGKIGEVIDYCLNDVVGLTKPLFDAVLAGTPLKNPTGGKDMVLRRPM